GPRSARASSAAGAAPVRRRFPLLRSRARPRERLPSSSRPRRRGTSRMRRVLPAFALALCSCATGSVLRERMRAVDNDLAVARKQRADQCAPRDLAAAEANLRFAEVEIAQGTGGRARADRAIAQRAGRAAAPRPAACAAL